jgi:hypothetical protein
MCPRTLKILVLFVAVILQQITLSVGENLTVEVTPYLPTYASNAAGVRGRSISRILVGSQGFQKVLKTLDRSC